jgi:mannosyl-oligosaccharide alpha-1,2-mannosidase
MGAVMPFGRRLPRLFLVAGLLLVSVYFLYDHFAPTRSKLYLFGYVKSSFDWEHREELFPVDPLTLSHLPVGEPHRLPPIQHDFSADAADPAHAELQADRRRQVKNAFKKCWESYRQYAWGYDELMPVTLMGIDPYAGWGATLVDALDTLWIMDLRDEFYEAVQAVGTIDWDNSTARDCSVFETNIRYVGGLLAAHELSGEQSLLDKAMELAHMLFAAFDTRNRMPVNIFNFARAKAGGEQAPNVREVAASVGTLSLEFTKITQLTGEAKFYDAIDRIKMYMEASQDETKLPGLWPTYIDLQNGFLTGDISFTLGALADSMYEYLPKMYILLGGLDGAYATMHRKAMDAASRHLLYRPMLPGNEDILFTGSAFANGQGIVDLVAESQHLACFTGGMYALGGRLLENEEHVAIGERLARGCAWAYAAFPTGVMPEHANLAACPRTPGLGPCAYNQTAIDDLKAYKDLEAPSGYTDLRDKRYILRPEAVESLFVLYRITGRRDLLDLAWDMFQSIMKATSTKMANSAIWDVTVTGPTSKTDSMESFWLAETLKYFYLIFSEPDLISLDDWVLNTEAHPFKIPKPS